MRFILLVIAALMVQSVAQAIMYRWEDAQGNTHFGDTPPEDAVNLEELDLPPLPTYEAPPIPESTYEPEEEEPEPVVPYKKVSIKEPPEGEARWSRGDGVAVVVQTKPAFRRGDKILVTVDGELQEKTFTTTAFRVPILIPGPHTISITIQDKNGNEVGSATSSFYVLRPNVNRSQGDGGDDPGSELPKKARQAPQAPQAPMAPQYQSPYSNPTNIPSP